MVGLVDGVARALVGAVVAIPLAVAELGLGQTGTVGAGEHRLREVLPAAFGLVEIREPTEETQSKTIPALTHQKETQRQ